MSGTTVMTEETTNDGEGVSLQELIFESGLPGFPDEHRFALVAWEDGPYASLQSLENPDLEFVVVPPYVFYPEYEPEIDDSTIERLGIASEEDVVLLIMVSINTEDVSQSTANLLGPIVINARLHRGAQAVLQNTEYDPRTPLISA